MKIIILGDIHGRRVWKNIIEQEKDADYYVFLGDYFDTYGLDKPEDMLNNFLDIITFKYEEPDKVKVLTGNHDIHYISKSIRPCSRFSREMFNISHTVIRPLLDEGTLQLCWKIPNQFNIWCSHAGFTNTWLRDNRLKLNEKELNEHFREVCLSNCPHNPYAFIDRGWGTNGYGDDVFQGPVWVRPSSLKQDSPINMYQIVGHTFNQWIKNVCISEVTLCDSLAWNQYYIYTFDENGETFISKKIEK